MQSLVFELFLDIEKSKLVILIIPITFLCIVDKKFSINI